MHKPGEQLPKVDYGIDIIGDEWDDNKLVGMTNYRYKDLPKWAKEQLNDKLPNKNNR